MTCCWRRWTAETTIRYSLKSKRQRVQELRDYVVVVEKKMQKARIVWFRRLFLTPKENAKASRVLNSVEQNFRNGTGTIIQT